MFEFVFSLQPLESVNGKKTLKNDGLRVIWQKRQKKGAGMILTEDEIREEVSIKPSIKQVLTDCKKYPFQWHV